jgi:hypothetical protein
MATAQTIINSALRKLGALGVGESPDATESGECLTSLNQMLEGWRNEGLMAYAISLQTKAINAGAYSVTIGTAGAWAIERPLWLGSAAWTESDSTTPIETDMSQGEWTNSDVTDSSGTPNRLYYDTAYPTGTLYFYPKAANAGTLTIGVPVVLTAFAALSTAVALPPGYERALAYNLAVELAPEYQITPLPVVMLGAVESKAALKRVNTRIPVLGIDGGLPGSGGRANILDGL